MTARLLAVTNTLGGSFGTLKVAIRPVKGDLAKEIARLEGEWKSQPPLWEAKVLLKQAKSIVGAVDQFISDLGTAKALVLECQPLLTAAEQHLHVRRESAQMGADIELLEAYTPELRKAARACGELGVLVADAESWEAIARVSAGRNFRAVAKVVRDYELLKVKAALESFRAQVERLRTAPSAIDADLTQLHGLTEPIVSQALPLLHFRWPEHPADPFTPPELV